MAPGAAAAGDAATGDAGRGGAADVSPDGDGGGAGPPGDGSQAESARQAMMSTAKARMAP